MTFEILNTYNSKLEDTCPKTNYEHQYQINDYQWLSNTIIEILYVYEECHIIKYLYHYMEGSDLIGL